MRVLHVLGEAEGAGWVALETIRSLKNLALDQHVVLPRAKRGLMHALRAAGVEVSALGRLARNGGFARTLARADRSFLPDVTQYWGAPSGGPLARHREASVAWACEGKAAIGPDSCAYFAAASRKAFDRLRADVVSPARLTLARPFSAIEGADPEGAQIIRPDGPPGLLRLHLASGQGDTAGWIAAVARGPDWRLALSGEPGAVKRAWHLARRHGVFVQLSAKAETPDLVLIPHAEDPPEALIADAWTAGWPVIAGGEMGGLLQDEANALIADPGAQGEIAGQIARALGDGPTRARLRLGGLESYEYHFAKSRFLDRLLGLYAHAAAGGSGQAAD